MATEPVQELSIENDDVIMTSQPEKAEDDWKKSFEKRADNRWHCMVSGCSASFVVGGSSTKKKSHFNQLHSSKTNRITTYMTSSRRPQTTEDYVIDFVVNGHHELSIVDEESFKKLVQHLDPSFQMSRRTLQRRIDDLFKLKQRRLHDVLKESKFKMAITTDDWRSTAIRSYAVVTIHFIDITGKLRHFMLDFRRHQHPHSGKSLSNLLEDVLMTAAIDGKLVSVTTDNAAYNINGINILNGRLGDVNLKHVRCIAHVLNLIVKKAISNNSTELDSVRDVVTYIRSSSRRLEVLQGAAVGLNQQFLTPSLDCETRWNSTLDMISRILKIRKLLEYMDGNEDFEECTIPQSTYELLRRLEDVLSPFKEATKELSGSNYSSYSMIFPIFNLLLEEIDRKLSAETMTSSRGLIQSLKDGLEQWKPKLIDDDAMIATILDPRFNISHSCFQNEDVTRLEALLREKLNQEYGDVTTTSQLQEERDDSFRGKLFKKKSVEDEISVYLKLEADGAVDPIGWWIDHKTSLRRLHRMALDLLVIPASSVPSEQAFSAAADVITDKRNRLSDDSIEFLMCLYSWRNLE